MNRVTQIQGLEGNTKMEELWLNNNRIEEFSSVQYLQQMSCLKTVYLEGNLLEKELYVDFILQNVKSITQIDAVPVRILVMAR